MEGFDTSASAPPTSTGAPSVAPAPAPAVDDLRDAGAVVRDSVRARTWIASGAVKVVGRVEAEEAKLSGTISLGGAVEAGALVASGTLIVLGPSRVRSRLELWGEARFNGSLDAGELTVGGTSVVVGPLTVTGLVHVGGRMELSGPATAGRLVLEGSLESAGEVVATQIDLLLTRPSRAAGLRGSTVRVRRRRGWPIPGRARSSLTVARIDADEAYLEGVVCEYVRADRIALGPDCHIARYDGTIVARHPSARLGPESRSPPPPGLSR